MRLSYNWLAEMVDLSETTPDDVARKLTFHTAEIDEVEPFGAELAPVVTARVTAVRPHPDADKLRLCTLDTGSGDPTGPEALEGPVEVVCGAPNVAEGQVICYAPEGVTLPGGDDGPIVLEAREIRGVMSRGMICSERELGLSDEHEGIIVLPDDTPIGKPLPDALGIGDTILELANVCITHRPDLWGHVGFARELGALLRKEVRYPEVLDADAAPIEGEPFPITIEDEAGCRRYVGIVIEGLENGRSPLRLRQRLESLGVRSISLLVDLTNLVLLEQGQPLHAFDIRDLKGGEIRVRRAAERERMKTLDDVERVLTPEDLVIADGERPVAIAGVMGGLDSEVREDTTTILLESATFDPIRVRRTATRLNLRTEASSRFEKSLDPELAMQAALRFAALALQHCPGARVTRVISDAYPRPPETIQLDLKYSHVRRRLGLRIPDMRTRRHLSALGFGTRETPTGVRVTVPSWRASGDVACADDLIEEIGRIEGYTLIEPIAPVGPFEPLRPRPARSIERRIGSFLSMDLGYAEVKHRSFYGARIAERIGVADRTHLMVHNPTSEEHDRMILTTAGNLLATVATNRSRVAAGRVWESARIVCPRADAGEGLPNERAVTGLATWNVDDEDAEPGALFLSLVDDVRRLCERLGVSGLKVADADEQPLRPGFPPTVWLHPGRRAVFRIGDDVLAIAGEVLPSVRRAYGLSGRVAVAELDTATLQAHATTTGVRYEPVLRYPVVPFDVAVVVPRRTPAGDVHEVIHDAVPESIRDLHVFDVYEGDGIPEGHRSLAFRCELFDRSATLTPAAADDLRASIIARLKSAGWAVRAG